MYRYVTADDYANEAGDCNAAAAAFFKPLIQFERRKSAIKTFQFNKIKRSDVGYSFFNKVLFSDLE